MKKAAAWSGILGLVITASGCGGGAAAGLLRDGTNTYSEMVDSMRRIVDEPSAQRFINTDAKSLKEKWDNLKKRMESFMRFGDDQDVDELAFLWLGDAIHNKGKQPGPVGALLKSQAGLLVQRIDKLVKKDNPTRVDPVTEQELLSGRLAVPKAKALLEQKSAKHLFDESAAARELFEQQLKRIKALRPPEPYSGLDFKTFTGDD
jgi:hypothetical protein